MHLIPAIIAAFGPLLIVVNAAIVGLGEVPSPYTATATSTIDITFLTAMTIQAQEDFSAVFGVYPATAALAPNAIGTRWHNVDLVALGRSSTGLGNFTLTKLPLTSKFFPSNTTSAKYVLAVGVTSGVGTNNILGVAVYTQSFEVTVAK
ncbi:hypothetical protein BKA62DRAFT_37176 [Auriculariales sp. MPI-PUGE-AT-0066]|nr:hypothetical protein BKA62DRAFT_37176 [Auriculariales sp. MPI-PUGE-AT-0066]